MKTGKGGFTLAEALIAAAMVAVVIGATAFMFQAIVGGWSTQGARSGLGAGANKAVGSVVRDLRGAVEIGSVNANEIRFTPDRTSYYIYYLYNAADSYPPQGTRGLYQLKKATLAGGMNGTFVYGSGEIIGRDILPPQSSLSVAGSIATVDLTVQRAGNTLRAASKASARNI